MENVSVQLIQHLVVVNGYTHAQVSRFLLQQNPGERGFSERCVRRFCQEHGILRSSRLSMHELDRVVSRTVSQVRNESELAWCSRFPI